VRLASDNASDSRGLSIIWVIPFRGTLDHAVTVVVRYPRTTYTCVCVCVCVLCACRSTRCCDRFAKSAARAFTGGELAADSGAQAGTTRSACQWVRKIRAVFKWAFTSVRSVGAPARKWAESADESGRDSHSYRAGALYRG